MYEFCCHAYRHHIIFFLNDKIINNNQIPAKDEQRPSNRNYKTKASYIGKIPKRKIHKNINIMQKPHNIWLPPSVKKKKKLWLPPTPIRKLTRKNQSKHLNQIQTPHFLIGTQKHHFLITIVEPQLNTRKRFHPTLLRVPLPLDPRLSEEDTKTNPKT